MAPFATVGAAELAKKKQKKAREKRQKRIPTRTKRSWQDQTKRRTWLFSEGQGMEKMDLTGPAVEAPAVLGGHLRIALCLSPTKPRSSTLLA